MHTQSAVARSSSTASIRRDLITAHCSLYIDMYNFWAFFDRLLVTTGGGYGANPIPSAMQKDWDSNGHLISGGMPYSEGIYLDMNQVLRQHQYWHADEAVSSGTAPTEAALRRYVEYEFGFSGSIVQPVLAAITLLESSYHSATGDATSQRAYDLLSSAVPEMTAAAKNAWRWRILYLRAKIDALSFNGTAANSKHTNKLLPLLVRSRASLTGCPCYSSGSTQCVFRRAGWDLSREQRLLSARKSRRLH